MLLDVVRPDSVGPPEEDPDLELLRAVVVAAARSSGNPVAVVSPGR